MKYVCCWSGGEDSTASIILAHLHGEPLDTILFAEVMFDEETSGENPEHIDFIYNKAKPLFESWGYEVLILRSDKTYMDIFNHIVKNPVKHPEHAGRKYGFAIPGLCSVKRDLKMKPIENYFKSLREQGECITQYIGICADEPKRLYSLHKNETKISLLEKYEYVKQMNSGLCEEYGLRSPCYKYSKRQGCWMCAHAKLEEQRAVRNSHPDAWNKFVALEKENRLVYDKWNVYTGETLCQRDYILRQQGW